MSTVSVYAHTLRSSLVEESKYSFVDEHLIRSLHIESIYDVIQFIGEINMDELVGVVREDYIKKLKQYREVIVTGEDADRILERINVNSKSTTTIKPGTGYVVLRLSND